MNASDAGCVIYVLAGPNGAGKSSVAGAAVRSAGSDVFDPDEVARRLREQQPDLSEADANSDAWVAMKGYLERAIDERRPFAFETTLGGVTITRLLREAAQSGCQVRIWYVALSSPELHIARVAQRVSKGGHAIPDEIVRARYDNSRANLVDLLSLAKDVQLFDNSQEFPDGDVLPLHVLHVVDDRVAHVLPREQIPAWARPIVAAALVLDAKMRS